MLQEIIIEDMDNVLPATNVLTSRIAHLNALRELRSVAASSYKSLKKKQDMMKALFGSTQCSSNPTYAYASKPPAEQVSEQYLGTPPASNPTYTYNSKSPAEQVLEEHLDKPPARAPNGNFHNAWENYTSKFPLGFEGCYWCGLNFSRNSTHTNQT